MKGSSRSKIKEWNRKRLKIRSTIRITKKSKAFNRRKHSRRTIIYDDSNEKQNDEINKKFFFTSCFRLILYIAIEVLINCFLKRYYEKLLRSNILEIGLST